MKDYYAVLGVVPSAEDVVIRAAYKALALRYHPDRNPGSSEAAAKMAELNEAYNILSDPVKRKDYDKARGGKEGDFGDWVHEEEAEDQAASSFDPLEKDWVLAVGFYPDLVEINNRLSKISHMLAFSYRAGLLDIKSFEKRKELAEVLEHNFLQTYFGRNPNIVAFARKLIFEGNRAASKALNDSIRVLGSDAPAERIINKICKDFNVETVEMKQRRQWKAEQLRVSIKIAEQMGLDDVKKLAASVEGGDFLNWCCWGHIDKVKRAVEKNPLLLAIADRGSTALHWAVTAQQQEVAKFLAGKGALVDARNGDGKSPVDIAKETGQTELAAFLQQFSVV